MWGQRRERVALEARGGVGAYSSVAAGATEEVRNMRRRMMAVALGLLASLLITTSALAFECTNASKPPAAGAQVVLAADFETILYVTPGLMNRIEQGLIDPDTGEGFHGLLGIDFDGDRAADVSIYFGVGPDGEIPLEAQYAGPACRGLTNIGILLAQCL